ncbi:hypothetical protein AGOR_G00251460 [Albula goreensis]|uniref:Uncharacterized protein n=1 Tax=Albula goreensis TaxID=1534307 RepID=A0A8T3CCI5_9TELE|nr:hypothetical protein AGOR_G00251460 [Albula goreensis]
MEIHRLNQPAGLVKGVAGKVEPVKTDLMKQPLGNRDGGEEEGVMDRRGDPREERESPRIRENGLLVEGGDPPHGSVTGSNGFILGGQQQEGAAAAPNRTTGSPVGASLAGHAAKTLPPSSGPARARNLGMASKTEMGSVSGAGADTETKNGTPQQPPSQPVVHRARKTMARPASNQSTLKLLNREIKEPNIRKEESRSVQETEKTAQQSPPPSQNQLPQSQNDQPAAPTKPQTAAAVSRKKKRKMGTYSLVPKKKTKVLKPSVLDIFKDLSRSTVQKESLHVNGESVENESEEDESEGRVGGRVWPYPRKGAGRWTAAPLGSPGGGLAEPMAREGARCQGVAI